MLHLKFIATFFMGNAALLRTNHSEHRARSFCLFLPLPMQKVAVKSWHPTLATCSGLRRVRQTTSPSERRKRPKVCEDGDELCRDGDELCRDEDASVGLGTFADPEHAHHGGHSLVKKALEMTFYEFFVSLDLQPEGGLIWKAGSLLVGKVCLPEGRGPRRVYCRDTLDFQMWDCPL